MLAEEVKGDAERQRQRREVLAWLVPILEEAVGVEEEDTQVPVAKLAPDSTSDAMASAGRRGDVTEDLGTRLSSLAVPRAREFARGALGGKEQGQIW